MTLKSLNFKYLSFFTLIFLGFLVVPGMAKAGFEWGSGGGTSGSIQEVPEGYALTAIGYGSDDKKCIIGIKTAPVNEDGSVNFQFADFAWRTENCSNGAPGASKTSSLKYFDVSGGEEVVTGWTWGAGTSGGRPGNDGQPGDECFYQEYMDLQTKQVFGWGNLYDGTCNERGYLGSWLKQAVYAPVGRVIVGIYFNIDDDADLRYLAVSTSRVIPPVAVPAIDAYVDTTENKTANFVYNKSTGIFDPDSKDVTISNTGQSGSSLDWQADKSADADWLNTTNMGGSGLSAGQSATKQIGFNTADLNSLPLGLNVGGIAFSAQADNSPQNIAVQVNVTENTSGGGGSSGSGGSGFLDQVDIKADNSDLPITIPYNQSATVTWGPLSGTGSGVPLYDNCTATGDWSGSKPVTGQFITPISSQPFNGSKTYTIACNTGPGLQTSDTITINYTSGTVDCTLKANGSTDNLAITEGQSVNWDVQSTPDNLTAYWHVSGSTSATDVPIEGSEKTNWSGTYSYSTAGTYNIYFHAENGGRHDACQGGKSNTVVLTVSAVGEPNIPEGVCSGRMGTLPVCYLDEQAPAGSVNIGECSNADPNRTSLYTCPAGKYWNIITSTCDTGSCPGPFVDSFSSSILTTATDGRWVVICYDSGYNEISCDDENAVSSSPSLVGGWADSLNGIAPLNGVDLRYGFSASFEVRAYRVDFDCTNDDTIEGTVTLNSINLNWTQIPIFNLCNYSVAGIYTASAKAYDRFGSLQSSDTADIVVERGNDNPSAGDEGGVAVTLPNYCASGPAATVSWTYSDPDNDPQFYYQVQIDDKGASFGDCEDSDSRTVCEVDSGQVLSSGASYASGSGKLSFGLTYRARVRVWDLRGAVSGWSVSISWATPQHAYPRPGFTWFPLNPVINQRVQFTDQTAFFDESGGVGQKSWKWFWKRNDGSDYGTNNVQNPVMTFPAVENYLTTLIATDKDGYACATAPPQNITVKSNIPTWKEVSPKP